jgi:ATP-dependent RNA helicase DDX49/DBP8
MSSLFGKSKRKRVQVSSTDNAPAVAAAAPSNEAKEQQEQKQQVEDNIISAATSSSSWSTFADLGLAEPLVKTCHAMGFTKPTPVQRTMIPFLLQEEHTHTLTLAATGSGKTAAFVLPILQRLQADPYGIYAVILTPTRELAKQIHQQVLALGSSAYRVQSTLVVGGLDMVSQSCALANRPHFCVATPGRLAELLRGPSPPKLKQVRYMVLDEADRLLTSNSGFERDVAEILLHTSQSRHCQTLLFSATLTKSLEHMETLAGTGRGGGKLPLRKFVIHENDHHSIQAPSKKKAKKSLTNDEGDDKDDEEEIVESSAAPTIPAGLKQEYVFMPSRVRDAYLLTTIRALMINGGRRSKAKDANSFKKKRREEEDPDDDDDLENTAKARSAIVFVSTCERCALVSGILHELGVPNVALHSLLSQNRRLAALGKFQSQHVRLLIATDVASRGLDIPSVDLVINAELPRTAVNYIHRVGRTARAGRRGRAISLVGEADVSLIQAAEKLSGRSLNKCEDITDDMAIRLLGPVTKAARLAKMKLMDIGFDELVQKMKERKGRDRKERQRMERRLKSMDKAT